MTSQAMGEAAVVPLATDANIGRAEPGTYPGVLPAEKQVDACRLAGDVLVDCRHSPRQWAGV